MISTLERRRAERFASLLAGSSDDRSDEHFEVPLAVSHALHRVPVNGDIDPAFRDRLRGRLVAVATVRPPAECRPEARVPISHRSAESQAPGWRRFRRLAVLGPVIVALMTVCGVVGASASATPGSLLYGIKRATESAQLALAGGDAARGQLQLGFAETRLGEAGQIRRDPAEVLSALAAMNSSIRQGSQLLTKAAIGDQDVQPLDRIDAFVTSQRPKLSSLLAVLAGRPSHAKAAESLALLDRLQVRADALRSAVRCAAPVRAPHDDLGPLPGTCVRPTNSSPAAAGAAGAVGGATGAGSALPAPSGSSPTGNGPSPSRSESPDPETAGLQLPAIPEVTGTIPLLGGHRSAADVRKAVDDVLGGVLGTLGVSPPKTP